MSHKSMKNRCSRCFGNLRQFLLSYPPMVLFTLSISLFALLLTLLAVYVMETRTLNEVDISRDWNAFLQSFSDLEFCVIQDNSSQLGSPSVDAHRSLDPTVVSSRTVSVLMSLTIHPTKDFHTNPHNNLHLSASMNAKYIGFKGSGGRHWINVTTIVPYRFNASSCSNILLQGCETVELDACLQLTGPPDVFPRSNRKPKTCSMPPLSGVDFWGKLNWQTIDFESVYYCRSRTMIGMQHEDDPRLFEPLRNPHRNVIQQHLLHTSFFLYIYVSVVVVYAMTFDHAKQRFLQSDVPSLIYDF